MEYGEANTNQKIGKEFNMNAEETFVTEVTENVENTTEETVEQVQPVKTYTEEEVNQIVGKKLARNTAKIRKEYEKKYGELETVLKAGTGKEDVGEMTSTFRQFYEGKGIQIPKEPTYSARDIEALARVDASDIISAGLDDVIEEVDRLASIGLSNMSAREKAVFKELAEYRKNAEQSRELSKLGVTEDVYNSSDFKEFAGKFSPSTSITEIYEIYNKMKPRKEVRTAGSMTSTTPKDTGVKDFYTRDEALQFTQKDFDENPALFKAVEKSMQRW